MNFQSRVCGVCKVETTAYFHHSCPCGYEAPEPLCSSCFTKQVDNHIDNHEENKSVDLV